MSHYSGFRHAAVATVFMIMSDRAAAAAAAAVHDCHHVYSSSTVCAPGTRSEEINLVIT